MAELTAAERSTLLREHLQDVQSAPTLWRFNGIGFTVLGSLKDDLLRPLYFAMRWFTVLWIPIFPAGIYLLSGDSTEYRFYKKLSLSKFHEIYQGRIIGFYFWLVVESLFVIVLVVAILLLMFFAFLLVRGQH